MLVAVLGATLAAQTPGPRAPTPRPMAPRAPAQPPARRTVAEARAFLDDVDRAMLRLGIDANRAGWVQSTFITPDTEALNAQANEAYIRAIAGFAKRATRFDGVELPADLSRRLYLLKVALTMPAPADTAKSGELTRIAAGMEGAYGRGKWCPDPQDCLDVEAVTKVMAESRDPKRLREVWEGWHTISVPMRKDDARFVQPSNEGAGHELSNAEWGECGMRNRAE